jgi:phospholipase C
MANDTRANSFTRRRLIGAGAGLAALGVLSPYQRLLSAAAAQPMRGPGSLPDPSRPEGTPTDALPFDHLVLVMQENHSFDNYFGMLPVRGQPRADGFTFDTQKRPLNTNPLDGGVVRVQHASSECQPVDVTQAWTPTHEEVDGGRMDGFAKVDQGQMLYYDQSDIPFYYSLANAFTVANRWFCSAPCQTFPNRRFFLCGTAFGLISTDITSVTQDPPNGTIVDRLEAHGITWKDYYVDVPATGTIASIPMKHPQNTAHLAQFYADCATGSLPSVCWVSSEIGLANNAGSDLAGLVPLFSDPANFVAAQDQDEENPADIQLGESFVSQVVNAVISSPAWPRTLLIWLYDEHGGYYDHVPPPAAIAPDNIPPKLGPNDTPGGYDVYGPRIPAVVASPYSRPHGVTDVLHDHTSVLATIEAKWNLPALTYRDANATTVADFLDTSHPALLEPPALDSPGDLTPGEQACSTADPKLTVIKPSSSSAPSTTIVVAVGHGERLTIRFYGRRHALHGVLVVLEMSAGSLSDVTVALRRGRRTVRRGRVARVGTRRTRLVLKGHFPVGRYTLSVRTRSRTLVTRGVHLG